MHKEEQESRAKVWPEEVANRPFRNMNTLFRYLGNAKLSGAVALSVNQWVSHCLIKVNSKGHLKEEMEGEGRRGGWMEYYSLFVAFPPLSTLWEAKNPLEAECLRVRKMSSFGANCNGELEGEGEGEGSRKQSKAKNVPENGDNDLPREQVETRWCFIFERMAGLLGWAGLAASTALTFV